MKVYYSLDDFQPLKKAIVTTGTFDGVHIGHKKILNQLHAVAQSNNGESVLLTFWPHPRNILQPDLDLKLLNTQREKIELLKSTKLDHLIVHPFTLEFSRTNSLDFVRNILVNKLGAKKLVIGHDHHFGRNREGSFEHLKEYGPVYGFDVEEISAKDVNETTVSSTKIRNALNEGDINTANQYLDYEYSLTGKIIEGDNIGRTIGFPTANILVETNSKLIPADGVYAIKAQLTAENKQMLYGMCNIGVRPTFGGKFKTIEVHLFEFNRNIYGLQMKLHFVNQLRKEVKFNNVEDLKQQLTQDEKMARHILNQH